MSGGEKVECDSCGLQARLRRDGTYGKHGYMSHGTRVICETTGQRYQRHAGSFQVISRNPNVWLCQCRCGETFLGPKHADVETPWLAHVAVENGAAS